MPEESLTNLKLLSNVVADYNYDYFIKHDGLKFHLVIISHIDLYIKNEYICEKKEMSSLRRQLENYLLFYLTKSNERAHIN